MRSPARAERVIAGAALALAFTFVAGDAQADWSPSGAIGGAVLIDVDGGRIGGVATVDLHASFGVARIGFGAGLGALTLGEDEDNRVFAPLGLSFALALGELAPPEGETLRVGAHLGARAGVWGGADFFGLVGGGYVTGGGTLDFRFRGGLGLGVGADVWVFFGGTQGVFIAPTLLLRWS